MKIFFRYLFLELLKPFLFCLIACAALWIVADLFGSLDEFFERNASWYVIAQFYLAQIPKMLVPVLPVAILFSSLFAILNLNRHNELTALFSGGLSPFRVFTPFVVLSLLVTLFLFYIMSGPATRSEANRNRILRQLRNDIRNQNVDKALVYMDRQKHRIWYLSSLNTLTGEATGIELLERNENRKDLVKYFAEKGVYNGKFWELRQVKKIVFEPNDQIAEQVNYAQLFMPHYTTPPSELALVQSMPEELTLPQLFNVLARAGNETSARMAPYRTQFHYLIAYPFTIIVLLGFAFSLGMQATRRNPAAGVFNAIFILLAFLFVMNFFLAMGRGNRLPAFLSAWAAFLIFGLIALYLIAKKLGWFWSLSRWMEIRFPMLLHPAGDRRNGASSSVQFPRKIFLVLFYKIIKQGGK